MEKQYVKFSVYTILQVVGFSDAWKQCQVVSVNC